MKAGEHAAKILGSYRNHCRQPNGGIHGISTAHPVPEPEHVVEIDAKLCDLAGVGRDSDEVPRHRLFVPERGHTPGARGAGIGQCLECGERLGTDDEQRLGRLEALHRLDEVRSVHVRYEAERHVPPAVEPQRLVGHYRPEIGPANADVDHVSDPLAGVARPVTAAHPLGKCAHPLEDRMDVGNDILPIDHDVLATVGTQRNVEHRAMLGHVDGFTTEHRLETLAQSGGLGKLTQQAHGLVGDTVLGVIDEQAGACRGEALAARRIVGEQLAQMLVLVPVAMLLQRQPLRRGAQFGRRRTSGRGVQVGPRCGCGSAVVDCAELYRVGEKTATRPGRPTVVVPTAIPGTGVDRFLPSKCPSTFPA